MYACTHRHLLAAGLAALSMAACSASAEDEVAESSDSALTSSVGFHRFTGSGAEITSWGDRIVVTDVAQVAKYDSDPATTPGILTGTIGWTWSASGDAFVAQTSGASFDPLRAPVAGQLNRTWSAAGIGSTLFTLTTSDWTNYRLERTDGASTAPTVLATLKAYHVLADDQFVYTTEPGPQSNNYRVVRRKHDGTGATDLGTYQDGQTFEAVAETWAATGGAAYTIPRGTKTVVRLGSTAAAGPVAGPTDGQASLAAAGGDVFIAAHDGLWRASSTGDATLIRKSDQMNADAQLSWALCGTREEYGRGAAITADASAVYLVCRNPSTPGQHALVVYSHAGSLVRRLALPPEWNSLGRLAVTSTHVCSMQQTRYSDSLKADQLRCFPK